MYRCRSRSAALERSSAGTAPGKSTLVGVLTGLLTPDCGDVAFDSEAAYPTRTRPDGSRQVACVYQKSTLAPTLSVAENLFINRQPGSRYAVHWTRSVERLRKSSMNGSFLLIQTPGPGRCEANTGKSSRSPGALLQGARFLILDEPTAALEIEGNRASLHPNSAASGGPRNDPLHFPPPSRNLRRL